MMHRSTSHQRGFALIAVMVFGVIALYSVSGLIGDGAVSERRAQDRELLRLRTHWAAMGHFSYALSRSRQGDPCGKGCNDMDDRKNFLDKAQEELLDFDKGQFKGSTKGKDRHWAYPEISEDYFFPLHIHVDDMPGNLSLALRIHPDDKTPIPHPFIAAHWPPSEAFAAIVCLGMSTANAPCPTDEGQIDPKRSSAKIARLEPR